ncbi:MAG TPA: phosphoadenylyl-sulfate reductase [Candidatus Paceibacterota bacterium]
MSTSQNFLNEEMSARKIIVEASAYYGDRLALLVSMQKTSGVLIRMVSFIAPSTHIIFVDTGVHFPETLEMIRKYEREYGVCITVYRPEETFEQQAQRYSGPLHLHDDEQFPERLGFRHCCQLRKERPFINAVKGRFEAVLSGRRRSSGGLRKKLELVEHDSRFNGSIIHPLLSWTDEMVDEYITANKVPVHPLHAKGYTSIGCAPCTTPVRDGEDPRAGRWRHIREAREKSDHLYCGINQSDTKPASK